MILQPLKSGLRTVRFGEIAENVAVRVEPAEAQTDVYVGLEHLDPETLHLRKWGHPSDVTGQKLAFKKGDVIFGRRRAYQRKLAVAEFDGICSAHAMVVRAKPEIILPEFLPFFLQSDMFMERAIEISVGSLSPTINWKTLRVQEFPLPPIEEQKRIAEILWAADETVRTSRRAVQISEELSETLKSQILKDTRCLTPLGECVEFLGGLAFKSSEFVTSGIQLLRMGNLYERTLDLSRQPVFLPKFVAKLNEKYLLAPGDIVMSLTGTVGKQDYGFALEIPPDTSPLLLNQRVAKLTPTPAINRQYLLHVLSSRSFLRQVYRVAAGTKQANVLKGQLLSIKIPLPPIDEQERVAQIVSLLDTRISALGRHIESQRLLCKALEESLIVSESAYV